MARKGKNKLKNKKQQKGILKSIVAITDTSFDSLKDVSDKQNMIAFGRGSKPNPNRRNPFQYGKGPRP